MRALFYAFVLGAPLLFGACSAGEGDRCNPLQYADDPTRGDCATGYECVYPTAPMCGVAYCCKVDGNGNVTDNNPNCQPDPTLSCAPDGSTAPIDSSVTPTIDMTTVD